MAQDKWDHVLAAKIGNPVPGKHTLDANNDIFKVGKDGIEQQCSIGINVLVQFGFSLGIDDAEVHFPCMQIDTAIKFVTLIVKSHDLPPFFAQWVNGSRINNLHLTLPNLRRQSGPIFFGREWAHRVARRRPENIGPVISTYYLGYLLRP